MTINEAIYWGGMAGGTACVIAGAVVATASITIGVGIIFGGIFAAWVACAGREA